MERLDGEIRRELSRVDPAERLTGKSGVGDSMAAIVRAWPSVVGAENAKRSWPARLGRDGVLVVHASDSVWAFQLGMLSSSIHERLAAALGETAPAGLRFVPGPIPGRTIEASHDRTPEPPSVGAEDAAQGAEIAAAIEDEELREVVARAAAASLARSRSDRAF